MLSNSERSAAAVRGARDFGSRFWETDPKAGDSSPDDVGRVPAEAEAGGREGFEDDLPMKIPAARPIRQLRMTGRIFIRQA
jgi:hypothetical protein